MFGEALEILEHERRRQDDQGLSALTPRGLERRDEFVGLTNSEGLELEPHRSGRGFESPELSAGERGIPQSSDALESRYRISHELELLATQLRDVEKKARKVAPWAG